MCETRGSEEKPRRDAHGKGAAHLLARRKQGTELAEQIDDVTTRGKERADDFVGLGDNLILIFFKDFADSTFARATDIAFPAASIVWIALRWMTSANRCQNKNPLNYYKRESEYVPSFAGPGCTGA